MLFSEEGAEDGVTEIAGRFFDCFAMQGGSGGGVDRVDGEGDLEAVAEGLDEGLVGVGFRTAEGVVDVDSGEADSEGVFGEGICGMEQEQQGGGVGSAGDGAADSVAGVARGGG